MQQIHIKLTEHILTFKEDAIYTIGKYHTNLLLNFLTAQGCW